MKTMMQDIITQAVKDIQNQQEQLIKDRLFAILGYELDIEAESRRVFPRLAIVRNSNKTTYYWNNSEEQPLKIITFIEEPMNFDSINDNKLSINLSYK